MTLVDALRVQADIASDRAGSTAASFKNPQSAIANAVLALRLELRALSLVIEQITREQRLG